MRSLVTEMPDGTLAGAVHPEVAIQWVTQCISDFIRDSATQYDSEHLRSLLEAGKPLTYGERQHLEREAKKYKWADQLSLKELEQLIVRLTEIVERAKRVGRAR